MEIVMNKGTENDTEVIDNKEVNTKEINEVEIANQDSDDRIAGFIKSFSEDPTSEQEAIYNKQIEQSRRPIEKISDLTLSIVKGILVKYGAKTIELPKSALAPLDFTLVVSGMYLMDYYIAIGEISDYVHGNFNIYSREFDRARIDGLTAERCTYTAIKHQTIQID